MKHGHSHLTVQAFGGNDTSGPIPVAACLNANRGCHNPGDFEAGTLLVLPFDTTQVTSPVNRNNPRWGDPCHALSAGAHPPAGVVAFPARMSGTQVAASEDLSPALCAINPTAVAFQERGRGAGASSLDINGDLAYALLSITGGARAKEMNVAYAAGAKTAVRRFMPVECERLQGFPDGYTKIPTWSGWRLLSDDETPDGCRAQGLEVRQSSTGKWRVNDADGPRYEALGNSWAVHCVQWIGRRINAQLFAL